MSTQIDVLETVMKQNGWPYTQVDEDTIRFDVIGQAGNWVAYAKFFEQGQMMMVFSMCTSLTPANKLVAMAEFITRANFGLKIGNFELDFNDGEVRFKTSVRFVGQENREAAIEQLITANVLTMDEYLPGLMALLHGGVSPTEAIALVEQAPPPAARESVAVVEGG